MTVMAQRGQKKSGRAREELRNERIVRYGTTTRRKEAKETEKNKREMADWSDKTCHSRSGTSADLPHRHTRSDKSLAAVRTLDPRLGIFRQAGAAIVSTARFKMWALPPENSVLNVGDRNKIRRGKNRAKNHSNSGNKDYDHD
ncbi:hypothetical protein AVEN_86503-1 [Araneus ventricosus]|uniref:Uncharacterized protein n=1 Tax=Araneus ventricosus TaxID=182803 RepID=A0A4Y2JPM2_ARAVE|nr:hypothetical protein AVEN_86503-1 [Araneus ventricosus]